MNSVSVLVDTLDLVAVREHLPSPNLPRFQFNRQTSNHPSFNYVSQIQGVQIFRKERWLVEEPFNFKVPP
jgi:hypothetical protein